MQVACSRCARMQRALGAGCDPITSCSDAVQETGSRTNRCTASELRLSDRTPRCTLHSRTATAAPAPAVPARTIRECSFASCSVAASGIPALGICPLASGSGATGWPTDRLGGSRPPNPTRLMWVWRAGTACGGGLEVLVDGWARLRQVWLQQRIRQILEDGYYDRLWASVDIYW